VLLYYCIVISNISGRNTKRIKTIVKVYDDTEGKNEPSDG
jgi:hypothetical protein